MRTEEIYYNNDLNSELKIVISEKLLLNTLNLFTSVDVLRKVSSSASIKVLGTFDKYLMIAVKYSLTNIKRVKFLLLPTRITYNEGTAG